LTAVGIWEEELDGGLNLAGKEGLGNRGWGLVDEIAML
jgi:hypothetical protein